MSMNKTPSFAKDMVIYEFATKGFTSPQGAESGTFRSACEKFPYLQDLGVNTLWITGHQLCDSHHFYNIWSQYAVIDPSQLDPSLGSEDDFRFMVEQAHKNGLRVILDVITHGVMASSPLVQEHPEWFTGGTWGMVDFDWYGKHDDLDAWWISVWTNMVKKFGVDGYRLDVAHYRPDLWCTIRDEAYKAGHPIVLIPESGPAVPGIFDTLQHGDRLSDQRKGIISGHHAFHDLASYIQDSVLPENEYRVEIHFTDETSMYSHTGRSDGLRIRLLPARKQQHIVQGGGIYQEELGVLRADNIPEGKIIENVIIRDHWNNEWALKPNLTVDYSVTIEGNAPSVLLLFPLRQPEGTLLSQQFTCHDNGWIGYPGNESPYLSQYSRFRMGYALFLAPVIPVIMSGEEFSADYVPLPQLSPDLYGGTNPGNGRWLYGSWLQWSQLEQPDKRSMHNDMRKLLQIRKEHRTLVHAAHTGQTSGLPQSLSVESSSPIPAPYLYTNTRYALLVAGNPYSDRDIRFCWKGGKGWEVYKTLYGPEPMCNDFTITKDRTPNGGLLIVLLKKKGVLNDQL